MCAENSAGTGNGDINHPTVAQPSLFHECIKFVDRHTEDVQSVTDQLDTSSADQPASSPAEPSVDGMQIIRYSLHEYAISPEIADIIMLSLRHSTHKQYKVYINKWVQFCNEKSVDPMHPTVNSLLKFLHKLYQQKIGYSALNTARSAVSNIDEHPHPTRVHTSVGKHPLVCRYLKGIFNKLKPLPKFHNIWSVDVVLVYLGSLWPLTQINPKALTLKLVMLIVLTTGQRCQTLTCMDISENYMTMNDQCFDFAVTEYVKQFGPGSVLGNVTLYKYPDKKLCVYETLQAYLQETRLCRSSQRLLISYIKPFKAVTSATIGRWIKTVLTQAGIDTNVFTAHSTRSASTSKAAR